MTELIDLKANLAAVQDRIKSAADSVGRDPETVSLVAVSKVQPNERVAAALAAGHRVFGENRVQEAKGKWPDFKAQYPGVELHLIGPLQTNKVADAVALFEVIETVDRPKLAAAIAKECEKTGRTPLCLIQVNTGEEDQKAGILPADADEFIIECRTKYNLKINGLMCIPPINEDPAPHFALLRDMARRHDLPIVSMGMSGDYELAVTLGATHVRVGTAVFGARDYE